MPFIVSCPQPRGRLFASVDRDGDVLWQPNRAKATPLTEAGADALETDLRRYSDDDYQIEGVRGG